MNIHNHTGIYPVKIAKKKYGNYNYYRCVYEDDTF